MKVKQVYELVNDITAEVLGSELLQEDLSNVVDVGRQVIDSDNLDNYVKKLINHIGKVIFVDRLYAGGAPSVLMDSWEYGSILEKISAELPDATENDTWNLDPEGDYNPDIFYKPKVSAKFFNGKVTFEIPLSFTERQVKESFSNAEQLSAFIAMLTVAVDNAMTVKVDALIMRTINNMIGETLDVELDGDYSESTVKAVNLLSLYNGIVDAGNEITVADCLTDRDFIRYATYQIGLYQDRMTKISTLFNVEGKERFTPRDMQKIILLSDFARASNTFLLSDTYNSERVVLPEHESVPYWQGSGETYNFDDVSQIDVKTSTGKTINAKGILGVMFDRDALGVTNLDRRVTTNYNPRAEFYTNFYKFDAGYFNDLGENFIVFFIAEETTP